MLMDLFFSQVGVLIAVCLDVIVDGGVGGGEDKNFIPSLLKCFGSVTRTSPGEGGGIDEPPELNEEATESVDSAAM